MRTTTHAGPLVPCHVGPLRTQRFPDCRWATCQEPVRTTASRADAAPDRRPAPPGRHPAPSSRRCTGAAGIVFTSPPQGAADDSDGRCVGPGPTAGIRVVVTSRPQGDCGGMSVAILELGTEGCLRRRVHAISVTVTVTQIMIVTAPAAAAAVPT